MFVWHTTNSPCGTNKGLFYVIPSIINNKIYTKIFKPVCLVFCPLVSSVAPVMLAAFKALALCTNCKLNQRNDFTHHESFIVFVQELHLHNNRKWTLFVAASETITFLAVKNEIQWSCFRDNRRIKIDNLAKLFTQQQQQEESTNLQHIKPGRLKSKSE